MVKKKKRLCIIYWDLGPGGIQKRIRDIVFDLANRQQEVEVSILLRRKSSPGVSSQVEDIHGIIIRYYPFGKIRIPLGFIFWLLWQYIQLRPTHVLVFQPLLSLVCICIKKIVFWFPTILTLNEGAYVSQMLQIEKKEYLKPFIRLLYRYANSIIVPTYACKEDLVQTFSLKKKLITIIPNWTLFPKSVPLVAKYDLLFAGRFSEEKNPLFVVGLVEKLLSVFPNVQVAMVGSGIQLLRLENAIKQNTLQNFIHVFSFSPDIQVFLRKTKLLILPSLNEGMPNIVLEAAMSSIPTVANKFLGAEDVILHGKTGYIGSSVDEIANYCRVLLIHKKKRKELGKAAQKYVLEGFHKHTQEKFLSVVLGNYN